jgi:hypothetical protein
MIVAACFWYRLAVLAYHAGFAMLIAMEAAWARVRIPVAGSAPLLAHNQ